MGSETADGTLADPFLSGVYDSSGTQLPKLSNDDGGVGANSFLAFLPELSGDYFIAAAGHGSHTGTYELTVEPDILW